MELLNFTRKSQRNQNNNPVFNYQNEDAILKVIAFLTCPDKTEKALGLQALGLPLGTPEEMTEIF